MGHRISLHTEGLRARLKQGTAALGFAGNRRNDRLGLRTSVGRRTGTSESSIFKAVFEKVQKQGMYARRRIFRPRFTFELRPLLEPFWTFKCQQVCSTFLGDGW